MQKKISLSLLFRTKIKDNIFPVFLPDIFPK